MALLTDKERIDELERRVAELEKHRDLLKLVSVPSGWDWPPREVTDPMIAPPITCGEIGGGTSNIKWGGTD